MCRLVVGDDSKNISYILIRPKIRIRENVSNMFISNASDAHAAVTSGLGSPLPPPLAYAKEKTHYNSQAKLIHAHATVTNSSPPPLNAGEET
jgi:hypothetical protein